MMHLLPASVATWTTAQWLALVGALVLVIVLLVVAWPRPSAGPDHIVVRVVDGPTVISTQVVPLH